MARSISFNTVRSEGGLLPLELLRRISEQDPNLKYTDADSYHLSKSERLGEAINSSWNRLSGIWWGFRSKVGQHTPGEATTSLTRERWLLPLFQELGYGRLASTKAVTIDERSYPISHQWHTVPIHLAGWDVDLDRRAGGVAGAATRSPYSLVQEYLNTSDDHLWGVVTNGRHLRLLRDNATLTRQAYVEFDLEAMLSGEIYGDFVLLWMVLHQSRFEAAEAPEAVIEKWAREGEQQGVRILDRLRVGVEQALASLGTGLLVHPDNGPLREWFAEGHEHRRDYYTELLRIVYRMLFLLVGEDRDLIPGPDETQQVRARYVRNYSMAMLRDLAQRRFGDRHDDLYRGLQLVFGKLGDPAGCPDLGLPWLGGFLWSPSSNSVLESTYISNHYLLAAVRALTSTDERRVTRLIDYANLGSEELGSIYESLLELQGEFDEGQQRYVLESTAGHERKTTGSYYTPTSLISELLNSALDPVLKRAASEPDPETAILDLKVFDPAVGSGHFLVAAGHRIARRLASIRTGDEEPPPEATRHAFREVVSHCLYGIDVNPMAVELCKVSLWLEAMEPGRPLSFLDHHIVCGNALLGATPRLLDPELGLPEGAFTVLVDDDPAIVRSQKAKNARYARGQDDLFPKAAHHLADSVVGVADELEALPDQTPQQMAVKGEAWESLAINPPLLHLKQVADAWCSAFFIDRRAGSPDLTNAELALVRESDGMKPDLFERVETLTNRHRFLHPALAFPQVFRPSPDGVGHTGQGWIGGFDVVIGNPPWGRLKLQEKRFFDRENTEIAGAPNKAAREALLAALSEQDPGLWNRYRAELRRYEAESSFAHHSGRFPLTGVGDVNTYALFSELARQILAPEGRASLIVQTGIVADDTTKGFFWDLIDSRSLVSVIGFENEDKLFPAVHNQTKFCIISMAAPGAGPDDIALSFGNRQTTTIDEHSFYLRSSDFTRINPNTKTCPVFRSSRDADIVRGIHERVRVLIEDGPPERNPWRLRFQRMFDMANDSALFRTRRQLEAEGWFLDGAIFRKSEAEYLPLLEGKMIDIYNPRANTYEGQTQAQANKQVLPPTPTELLTDPGGVALPKYWVDRQKVDEQWAGGSRTWALGWRDIGPKERTLIPTIVPRWAVGHKLPLAHTQQSAAHIPALLAALASFLVDFLARNATEKGGMSYFIVKQLAIPDPATFGARCSWADKGSVLDWVTPRVLELVYTTNSMETLARDLGYGGSPFRWDEERRAGLRAELDAGMFLLYGVVRSDVEWILDSFYLVRDSETKTLGEYRAKRLILECFDQLSAAVEAGGTYASPLLPA